MSVPRRGAVRFETVARLPACAEMTLISVGLATWKATLTSPICGDAGFAPM
ncbi:MAG: hypothetical protein O2901_10255 [Verrucomicrobia bacterium]|nr:hypothetical protein [Verrucomicrobiota bacterium]